MKLSSLPSTPPPPLPLGQARLAAALLYMLLRRWRRAAARAHHLSG